MTVFEEVEKRLSGQIQDAEKRLSGQIQDAEKRLSDRIATNSEDIKTLIRDVAVLKGRMSLVSTSREPQVAEAAGASEAPEPSE